MPKHEAAEQQQGHYFSNGVYDALKFIAQILLPALGTLYFTLAAIWGLPNADAVSGTVLAVDTFLGVILGLSSAAYKDSDAKYDGVMHVEDRPGEPKLVTFEVPGDPHEILDKKEVIFRLNPVKPEGG